MRKASGPLTRTIPTAAGPTAVVIALIVDVLICLFLSGPAGPVTQFFTKLPLSASDSQLPGKTPVHIKRSRLLPETAPQALTSLTR
jgi:hypothetical protein